MRKLIIFGKGDFAELAKYYFEKDTQYKVCAFTIDDEYLSGSIFCDMPLIGFNDIEKTYSPEEYDFFVAIGYSKVNLLRETIFYKVKEKGFQLASYISPNATILINKYEIGENCMIFENVTIQPFSKIGNNVILWSDCIVCHHSLIGDNVFIATNAVILGRSEIGNNCFIGANSTINDHVKIAPRCVIGSGALITRDTEPDSVYKGQYTTKADIKSSDVKYFK